VGFSVLQKILSEAWKIYNDTHMDVTPDKPANTPGASRLMPLLSSGKTPVHPETLQEGLRVRVPSLETRKLQLVDAHVTSCNHMACWFNTILHAEYTWLVQ
jgi:hypothetical protein